MKNILKVFILILSINLIVGCSNKKAEEAKLETNRKKEQLLRKNEYEEAKGFIQGELGKANEVMQTINAKLDEIEKVEEFPSMRKEDFYYVRDLYNNMFYVLSGYVADEGINVNHWGSFREMKDLKESIEWVKSSLDSKSVYPLIATYRQIKPRALEVDTPEFKDKVLIVSAIKRSVYDNEKKYTSYYEWGKTYKDYNIDKISDNLYNSHGKVRYDGAEHNFSIDLQVNNGEVNILNYSFQ